MKNRKFWLTIIGLVILLGVFVMLMAMDELTDGIFIAWLAALTANLGIHAGANVMSKNHKP
ncbi:hypothetical protein LCGC14_2858670 [marine sediment metagenome]|uniref:Uncharacterized protein n=1 Tax=marine sediment metagenome TaxID=412755 RepID=A0A0F8Y698_9ZZZZ